jgi:uncharacterized protein (UPF0264 family)
LIDIKEPNRGSLGRADDAIIAAVMTSVAGRRPVSAALGELADGVVAPPPGLAYAKWGLAGLGNSADWRGCLAEAVERVRGVAANCAVVPVAYADARRAAAPPADDVCAFACRHRCGAFLVDTFVKDGSGLLDHASLDAIARWGRATRAAGVRFALAGSLVAADMIRLAEIAPDWFAVRGAACRAGDRRGAVDELRVRELADLLRSLTAPASPS